MEINNKSRWPVGFMVRMQQQLGTEAEVFFRALESPPPTSIRLHHFKGTATFELNDRVKWCDTGYYLHERPPFHLDPHWHGGAYYVQEASSMILDEVIRQLALNRKPKIWLDLCAAPGGKTGILAKHLGEEDVLIANELVIQRRSVLYENLIKAGFLNTFISGEKSSSFPEDFADVILIDAPCAGEGMMRKEPEAAHQWSEKLVQSCAAVQKEIVRDAVRALKPGGRLVYSTCSYSPDENLDNANHFLASYDLEMIPFSFPDDWNIAEIKKGAATGYQLFPHKVKGEGLFIAAFQKKERPAENFIPKRKPHRFFQTPDMSVSPYLSSSHSFLYENRKDGFDIIPLQAEAMAGEVRSLLPKAQLISRIGEQKGKDFIPSHFLSMSGIQGNPFPFLDMDLTSALDYLERKIPYLEPGHALGWHIVRYNTTRLGWLKNTRQGWKNYYPMNWRLRQRT